MNDKTNLIFFSFIATNLPLFTHSNNGASQLMHKNLTLQSFAQVPSGVVVFFICANKLEFNLPWCFFFGTVGASGKSKSLGLSTILSSFCGLSV